MQITIDEIKENLHFAAQIMRRLPSVKTQGYCCAWPSFYLPPEETNDSNQNWLEPLPYEITAMEEILEWLKFTKVEYRRVVWLRACNIGWKQIARYLRRGRSSVCRDYAFGLAEIQEGLKNVELPNFMKKSRYYPKKA